MMAAYLVSSPAPAYPAAAFQARVQGEVTVRAVVDREGNITDARVISGPELLRDAALEAVQHWRYRPYTQDGKPIEVDTTAIVDFELP
jgi:TonB family protein